MKDFIEGEEWRDIVGYEGRYVVSNLGRVYSLPKRTGKRSHNGIILKNIINVYGYHVVALTKNNVIKQYKTSRLVAFAFLETILGKNYVDHIDGNKLNNIVTNLRWCTSRENITYACEKRTNMTKYTGVHLRRKDGKYYSQIYKNGKNNHLGVFDNQEDASRAYQNALMEICDYENECLINRISHKNGDLADIL